MHETKQYITSKEQELMRIGHISKALAQWISGNEFEEIQNILDEISKESNDTNQLLQKTQASIISNFKKANDKQNRIQQHVLNQSSLLSGLKNLLSKSGDGEK
jgi:NifU-like protein involved in Fe-S cluster formation